MLAGREEYIEWMVQVQVVKVDIDLLIHLHPKRAGSNLDRRRAEIHSGFGFDHVILI